MEIPLTDTPKHQPDRGNACHSGVGYNNPANLPRAACTT
jgi:hypothetical protein